MSTEYNVQLVGFYYMVHKWTGGVMPEVSYKVTVGKSIDCACPAGRYGGKCKHKRMVINFIAMDRAGLLDEGKTLWFCSEDL